MAYYSTNELKSGTRILIDGEPYSVLENDYFKPGKGQALNRIKLRHVKSSRILDRTLKSGERVEAADVVEIEVDYLYQDQQGWYFMDPAGDFEQYTVASDIVGEAKNWLKMQMRCTLVLFNGEPIQVIAPNFVVLKVADTDPGVRGDTSSGGSKPATLETGAVVRVPLFVRIDDLVKVDTRTGTYLERFKE
jgi:elongation factor P